MPAETLLEEKIAHRRQLKSAPTASSGQQASFCPKRASASSSAPAVRLSSAVTSGDGRHSLTTSGREMERERDASMADEAVKRERRSQVWRGMGRSEEEGEGKDGAGAGDGRSSANLLKERRSWMAGMMVEVPEDCDISGIGKEEGEGKWGK